MSQIIPYLFLLPQHLNSLSSDPLWITSLNEKLIELLQFQENSDQPSEEFNSIENHLLKSLTISLIQLLTGQCLCLTQKQEKDSTPPYKPFKHLTVDFPLIIESYQDFKNLKKLAYTYSENKFLSV